MPAHLIRHALPSQDRTALPLQPVQGAQRPEIRPRNARQAAPWWDEPITVGILLTVAPPIGLSALWASRHFSERGRLAISALMAIALFTVAFAILTRH